MIDQQMTRPGSCWTGARTYAAPWNHGLRMFGMACAELCGYAGGEEGVVAHHRLVRRP
jgi:cyclopropane-fatty-acyl-phospholipid synthase